MSNCLSKIKENRETILITAVFAVFPLVCAMVYSILGGQGIADVYLPASYWNDELMYYKQVEAVVNYGLPQGWFGYQESHGSVYPFAVWSPAVLLPWVIWGALFGWGLVSPIYANIVYNMIAMAAFGLLVKPTRKQSVFLLALFAAFTPYSRYLLSGMPESVYMALGIIMAALVVSHGRQSKNWKIAAMFAICVLITLGRPYLGLLMIFPMWFLVKEKKWIGGLISVAIGGLTAFGYVMITKLSCASYVVQSLETDWLTGLFQDGVAVGFGMLLETIKEKLKMMITYHFADGIRFGLISGAMYIVVGVIALLLAVRSFWALKKGKDQPIRWICLLQAFITVGMIAAIFLFYRLGEGSKHLMIFIVLGMIWIALLDEKLQLLKLLTMACCLYFFVIKAWAPYDWQVAYDQGGLRAEAEAFGSQLQANMTLAETENRYDDTVIWLASDMIDGESVAASWGLLYMIPEGFAINFCTQEYVMTNIDQLHSAYVAVLPGGEVDKVLKKSRTVVVGESEHMKVYKLR